MLLVPLFHWRKEKNHLSRVSWYQPKFHSFLFPKFLVSIMFILKSIVVLFKRYVFFLLFWWNGVQQGHAKCWFGERKENQKLGKTPLQLDISRTSYLSTPGLSDLNYLRCWLSTDYSLHVMLVQQLPGWWVWYSYICPLAWVMNGLVTSQFGDISTPIDQPEYEGHPQSVQEWLASYFDFHHEKLPLVASVALALALLFAVIYIMAIKFLNFQHR